MLNFKTLGIILIAILLVTGCQEKTVETPVDEIEEPTEESSNQLLEDFKTILESEDVNSSDIGQYIESVKSEASASEMEVMIEQLVLYQSETIEDMNRKIYDDHYMEALNETMGGVLEPNLVETIENETVKADYQKLVHSYLTIVRYEETPVTETDWEALREFNDVVSDDFRTLINLRDNIQNNRYGTREIDFEAIIRDNVLTEKLIKENEPSFLTWQLEKVYGRQISSIFVGPEGSYLNTFIDKESELYKTINENVEAYPDAKITTLVELLDRSNVQEFQDMNVMISNFNVFGVESSGQIVSERLDGGESLDNIMYVHFPDDQKKERIINDAINEITASKKQGEEASNRNRFLYANDHYVSLSISSSYSKENGLISYKENLVTFDLETMQKLSLKSFLENEGKSVDVSELIDTTEDDVQDFAIDRNGLLLKWTADGQSFEEYDHLWFYEISPYVSLEKVYK